MKITSIQTTTGLLVVATLCKGCFSENLRGTEPDPFSFGHSARRDKGSHMPNIVVPSVAPAASYTPVDVIGRAKEKAATGQAGLNHKKTPNIPINAIPSNARPSTLQVAKELPTNITVDATIASLQPSVDAVSDDIQVVPAKSKAADDDDNTEFTTDATIVPVPANAASVLANIQVVPAKSKAVVDDDDTGKIDEESEINTYTDDQSLFEAPAPMTRTPTKARSKSPASVPKTKGQGKIVYKTFAPVESPATEAPVIVVYKTLAPHKPRRTTSRPVAPPTGAPSEPWTDAPVVPLTSNPTNSPTQAPTNSPTHSPTSPPTESAYVEDDTPEKEKVPGFEPSPKSINTSKSPTVDSALVNEKSAADDLAMEEEELELGRVEKEAKTAGGLGFLLAMGAMVFTAYQMSENPDGIFASVCRLAITLIGCGFKMVTMPCRNLLGHRYHAGHIPVSTMEYRDPYRGSGNMMEMT